jgi:hypothetical protein
MTAHRVSEALALAQDMMMSVVEGQWDSLMTMQLKQDEMVRQLFATEGLLLTAVEQQDLLELQRLNQEVLNAAENHKLEVAKTLTVMRQGKLKAKTYQSL